MLNPNLLSLDDEDLLCDEIIDRQIPVKGAKVNGRNGRIDVHCKFHDGSEGICELKKVTGTMSDINNQLSQYLTHFPNSSGAQRLGILMAPQLDDTVKTALTNGYSVGNVPIAGIEVRRFKDDTTGQVYLTTEVFYSSSNKNRTKYDFGSLKGLSKSRVKVEVAREYSQLNPQDTAAEFRQYLPKIRTAPVLSDQPPYGYSRDKIRFVDGAYFIDNQGRIDEMPDIMAAAANALDQGKLKSKLSESK